MARKKIMITKAESIALSDIIEHWFMHINDENWTFDNGKRYHHCIDDVFKKLRIE
jgi:hypothetical protein|tara:strand:+ start:1599 stop:1763 length:165 start_codon:yes stop_codon:yes gene_type:complete